MQVRSVRCREVLEAHEAAAVGELEDPGRAVGAVLGILERASARTWSFGGAGEIGVDGTASPGGGGVLVSTIGATNTSPSRIRFIRSSMRTATIRGFDPSPWNCWDTW